MLPVHIAKALEELRSTKKARSRSRETWPELFRSEKAYELFLSYACTSCRFGAYNSMCEECHHTIAKTLIPDLCEICSYAGVLYACAPCAKSLLDTFHGCCGACVQDGEEAYPCNACWEAMRGAPALVICRDAYTEEEDSVVEPEAEPRKPGRSWRDRPPIDAEEFDAMIKHIAEFSDCLTVAQLSQLTLALTHHALPQEQKEATAGTVFQPTAGLTVSERHHPVRESNELQVDAVSFGDLAIRFLYHPANIYVRLLVRTGDGWQKTNFIIVEQFSGNDALGSPRWEPIKDPTQLALITAEAALLVASRNVARGGGYPVDLQATKRVEAFGGPTVSGLASSYGFTLFGR